MKIREEEETPRSKQPCKVEENRKSEGNPSDKQGCPDHIFFVLEFKSESFDFEYLLILSPDPIPQQRSNNNKSCCKLLRCYSCLCNNIDVVKLIG